MNDSFDLQRFVAAQDAVGIYDEALREVRAGRKTDHWMWFVFPQIAGLGLSAMSKRYAIKGLDEARAYLAHSVLGPRLIECAQALTALKGDDPVRIFGGIDAQKLRSSMTLFARAGGDPVFTDVLARYFGGEEDPGTLARLGKD